MHTRLRGRGAVLLLVASLTLLGVGYRRPARSTPITAPAWCRRTRGPTPHVMNGSVDAITQVGNKIIAAGTFTSVSPAGTFGNTSDDVVRNRIFAFDATTGAIDPAFNPNLGARRTLDTDGTSIYVGGSFGSRAATRRSSGWSS